MLIALDQWLFRLINQSFDHELITQALQALSVFFSAKPFIISVLGFLIGWVIARRAKALAFVVGLILCGVGADNFNSQIMKPLFQRPRPFVAMNDVQVKIVKPQSSSFPSSHAVTAFAVATYVSVLIGWPWLWMSLAVMVALTRVYMGVHYPSDIMAGALLGCAIGAFFIGLVRLLDKKWLQTSK